MNDITLLRQVITHARANGWSHDTTRVDNSPREHRWMRDGVKVSVWGAGLYVNDRKYWPESVRQAVNLLVDLDVLPVKFHSAYAAAGLQLTRLQNGLESMGFFPGSGVVPEDNPWVDAALWIAARLKNENDHRHGAILQWDTDKYAPIRVNCAHCVARAHEQNEPATEEPARTLTAVERDTAARVEPYVGEPLAPQSRAEDAHECGYTFREGLGYLANDPECEACREQATAKWESAWKRGLYGSAITQAIADPVTDAERVSDAIDAKAVEL